LFLEDEVSPHQPAAWLKQPTEQGRGDGKRRVGDHRVRAARQSEIRGVDAHDDHVGTEAKAEVGYPIRMGLDGNDPSAELQQRLSDNAAPGADVQDPAARPDP
jgi:hypothetical protein